MSEDYESDYDPDANVTLTLTSGEVDLINQVLANAAGYRDPHHCRPHDALAAFVGAWIEASGWDKTSDYGPWAGFIEMVEDLQQRRERFAEVGDTDSAVSRTGVAAEVAGADVPEYRWCPSCEANVDVLAGGGVCQYCGHELPED